ncbi:MAG TPA: hypothetical protein VMU83_17535 [Hanamia sp.]|nr:hypothetical protein [Hanamia sp.]
MHLILQYWNTLIHQTLLPERECPSVVTDESIESFIKQFEEEQDKVHNLLLEGMLKRSKLKDKQQWVRITQAMLIRLIDKLYSYTQSKEVDLKIFQLYKIVIGHLEDTLNFIKDFFGIYFDYDERVPVTYLIISLKELSTQVILLQKMVQHYKPYIQALAEIIVNNFNKFCQENKNAATYNQLEYQKDLMDHLLTNKTLASENSISEVLFYFDYNDHDYIAYLKEKLSSLTESLDIIKEKIIALRFEQKTFNQLPKRLIGNLNSNTSSLIEQMNQWIEEEIKFLESVPIQNGTIKSIETEKIYVHVPFKGSEIYLVHKAFIDSGGAPGETYKSLFEKTASHLTNKNQRGFSTESLQKNSDKVDYEAKENVKRFLQKMIRNIDSY